MHSMQKLTNTIRLICSEHHLLQGAREEEESKHYQRYTYFWF